MIVIFDGVCNLCNGFVDFVIRRDDKALFRFASLQGEAGKQLLRERGLDTAAVETIVLVDGDRTYQRSEAAIRVLRELRHWRWTGALLCVPLVVRDGVYRLIAKYRYRLLGKRETCRVATPEEKSRFLE